VTTCSGVLCEARFAEVDASFLLDVRGWLEPHLPGHTPDLVRRTAVVLGELMANAFRHAEPPYVARLTAPRPGDTIRVEVHDGTPASAGGWALGRGLLIVRDVCPDWGVEPGPDGKIVWAELSGESA